MIISNISHLEAVAEENSVTGGIAVATSSASAYANGPYFAGTSTGTYTSANFQPGYYYGYPYPYYYQQSSYNASSSANSSSSVG